MAKVTLNNVSNGYNVSNINANFEKIEQALNEGTLWRDNPEGEPNQLENDIDVNGQRLYNLPEPVLPSEAVRLQEIKEILDRYRDSLREGPNGQWDGENKRLNFLAPGIASSDAVNRGQMQQADAVVLADAKRYTDDSIEESQGPYLRIPEEDIIPVLPPQAEREGKFLSFNADGVPIAIAPVTDSALDLSQKLADNADPNLGASLIGYIPDAAGARGRTQAEINSDYINMMDFEGADNTGAPANNRIALRAAIQEAKVKNKSVVIPPGVYDFNDDGLSVYIDDVHIHAEGVVIDNRLSAQPFVFRILGGAEEEIPIGANVTRGDTVITTATPNTYQPGDWLLLQSQRPCSHPDAGVDWQLGSITGGEDGFHCYFGEPVRILSVESDTSFTIDNGLIFPDYNTDRSQETYNGIGVRQFSTVKKINFSTGKITGWPFIYGSTVANGQAIHTQWALNAKLEVVFDFATNPGGGIYELNCFGSDYQSKSARDPNWQLNGVDHSQFNSYRCVSSWYSKWKTTEWYGSQGWDESYVAGNVCCINCELETDAYFPIEQGATSHGNSYGLKAKVRCTGSTNSAMTNRARFADLDIEVIGNADSNTSHGLALMEWGAVNTRVKLDVKNSNYAVRFLKSYNAVPSGPDSIDVDISGNISNCQRGFSFESKFNPTPLVPSNIHLHNIRISNTPTPLFCDQTHWHGFNIHDWDIICNPDDTPIRLFSLNNNSGWNKARNLRIYNSNAQFVFYVPRITDTNLSPLLAGTTLEIDFDTIDLINSTASIADGSNTVPIVSVAQNIITNRRFNKITQVALSGVEANRTINLVSGYADAMPVGSWIEIAIRGDSAQLLVTATAPATIVGQTATTAVGQIMRIYRAGSNMYICTLF